MSAPYATPPPEGELQAAWHQLLARKGQLRSDRKLARLALEFIRELGNQPSHREVLRDIANSWTEDPELTWATATLLLEQAARRGMDEPVVSDDTPARWASDALRRALEALEGEAKRDPLVAGVLWAGLGNALRLAGPGHDAAAQAAFDSALELDARRGSWWYDAGLLHKWRGRLQEGLRANQQALEHDAPRRAALWNLAICATGVGEGDIARDAWSELGMPAFSDPNTNMPLVEGLPPLLVRVLSRPSALDGTSELPGAVGFELVWVAPLSPCHGVVQSPTFRDAPIDYGDLVLWDGAPVAERRASASGPVPVFPLLEILSRGNERRWPFVSLEREPDAVAKLEPALPPGTRVFVQQEQITHHCPACEAGLPHDHTNESIAPTPTSAPVPAPAPVPASLPSLARGKIILPVDIDLPSFRDAWEAALGVLPLSAALPALYEELRDTKRAGQEHQAWRGIERKALRAKAAP